MYTMIPYRKNNNQVALNHANSMNLFDNFFRGFFDEDRSLSGFMTDVQDMGDHYLLEADMPGMKKENIHIDVDNGYLTVSAEAKTENEEKNEQGEYVFRERSQRSMRRSFSLDGIDEDKINAEYVDGVLKLTLPKMQQAEGDTKKTIEVK